MTDVRETQLDVPATATKAIFRQKGGPIEFVQYDPNKVELKPGEVLVRITYTGVCHTCVASPPAPPLCSLRCHCAPIIV